MSTFNLHWMDEDEKKKEEERRAGRESVFNLHWIDNQPSRVSGNTLAASSLATSGSNDDPENFSRARREETNNAITLYNAAQARVQEDRRTTTDWQPYASGNPVTAISGQAWANLTNTARQIQQDRQRAADAQRLRDDTAMLNTARSELDRLGLVPSTADRWGDTLAGAGRTFASGLLGATDMFNRLNQQGRSFAVREAARSGALPAEYSRDVDYLHQDTELNRIASRLYNQGQQNIQNAQKYATPTERLLVNLGVSGTQMLADAVVNHVVPGAGLAMMGARVFGNSALEAQAEGATVEQQLAYGAANAAVEVFSEKMFGMVSGIYGKGAGDKLADKLLKKIATDWDLSRGGRALMSVILGAGEEGFEETFAGAFEPALKAIYKGTSELERYTDPEKRDDLVADILYETLCGAILGVVGSGTQVGLTERTIRSISNNPAAVATLGIDTTGMAPAQIREAVSQELGRRADEKNEPRTQEEQRSPRVPGELRTRSGQTYDPVAAAYQLQQSGRLGVEGMRTFASAYNASQDANAYESEMYRYYEAGRQGQNRRAAWTSPLLTTQQRNAAYFAGVADSAAQTAAMNNTDANAAAYAQRAQQTAADTRRAAYNRWQQFRTQDQATDNAEAGGQIRTTEPVAPVVATPTTEQTVQQTATPRVSPQRQVEISTESLYQSGQIGTEGRETLAAAFNPAQDPGSYRAEMLRYYQAGARGTAFQNVDNKGVLTASQRKAAYTAGQADAATEAAGERTAGRDPRAYARQARRDAEKARLAAVDSVQRGVTWKQTEEDKVARAAVWSRGEMQAAARYYYENKNLGDAGRDVLAESYDPESGQNGLHYIGGMMRVYGAGALGADLAEVQGDYTDELTAEQRADAWAAGQLDAERHNFQPIARAEEDQQQGQVVGDTAQEVVGSAQNTQMSESMVQDGATESGAQTATEGMTEGVSEGNVVTSAWKTNASPATTITTTATTPAEAHIDNRTMSGVGDRKINAFQFDHPELHPFFVEAAERLITDAERNEDHRYMSHYPTKRSSPTGKKQVYKQQSTELLDMLKSEGMSLPQIKDAAQRIISDEGQENVAAAKRVEIVLDKMLTDGYKDGEGGPIGPNQAYIQAKARISGGHSEQEIRLKQAEDSWAFLDSVEGAPDEAELQQREQDRQRIREQYPEPSAQTSDIKYEKSTPPAIDRNAEKTIRIDTEQATGKQDNPLRAYRTPTYEELISKKPIPVLDIGSAERSGSYADLKADALQKAIDEKWFDAPFQNSDTGIEVFITPKSFTHAFSTLSSSFGKDTILAMEHLPELIQNAVLTHVDPPRNARKAETRVFSFFAAVDGEQGVEPVKLTVKEYPSNSQNMIPQSILNYYTEHELPDTFNRLYDVKALELVNVESAKTESGASASVAAKTAGAKGTPNSNISIADLLSLVNDDAKKYIPSPQQTNEVQREISTSTTKTSVSSKGSFDDPRWTAERRGDTNKKPKPLSDIIEQLRHDFKINITTGHIRGKGVRGQYNAKNQGIRTRVVNNLPTIAHELGHHLDNLYSLTGANLPAEARSELLGRLDPGFANQYPASELPGEGVAEFLRAYLQEPEQAAADYPKFYDHLQKTLNVKDRVLLEKLADDTNAYYALDGEDALSSIRLRNEPLPNARAWYERAREMGDRVYQAMTDTMHAIKRFDEATGSSAYKLAINSAYSDAMAGAIITGDLTDMNGQYVAPGLKTALHGVDLRNEEEYKAFGEYLVVRHGPDRLKNDNRVFADDRKNNAEWMSKRQAELEAQYPEFKAAAERLYKFQDDFRKTWMIDTGLISADTAKQWKEKWGDFYVPFNRAVSEQQRGVGAKRGFANQNSTVHAAYGSGLDIIHPVDNIIGNMVKVVNAGVRNHVMQVITDQAEQLGANAYFLEKIPAPMKKRTTDISNVKAGLKEALENSKLDPDAIEATEEIIDGLDDILTQYELGKAHGDVVTVLKDGKPEFWKINDPMLLKSLTNMAPTRVQGVLEAYAVSTRFISSNITGNNIIWALSSNAPRDLETMLTYSKDRNPLHIVSSLGSTYLNRIKDAAGMETSPFYKEYVAMGGGQQSAYSADRDLAQRARKQLQGRNFDRLNPLDYFSFVSDTVEMGPRFATYKMMREAGMDPQEAFYEAMDITVNFRRGGTVSRQINKLIPFFNANMQGIDKFARFISGADAPKETRGAVVRGRFIAYMAVNTAMAALGYALNHGDDDREKEYRQLSTYTKNSYFCIPIGDGKYLGIMKPREIAVLESGMERILERTVDKNNHAFDGFYDYATSNFLPTILSDIVQFPAQAATEGMDTAVGDFRRGILGSFGVLGVMANLNANKDFLGRPIVSSGLQYLEPRAQYTANTSMMAYGLGQALNISPQRIDYFFNNTLGGFWKYPRALFPVDPAMRDWTLGVKNTYIKDSQYSTDLTNWLYDKQQASEIKKNSHPEDIDAAITAKMDSNMTDFYGRYSKLVRSSPNSEADRGTRQEVLDMIYDYQAASDYETVTPVQAAVYAVCRSQGEANDYLPAVMPVTIKDSNDAEHELSAVQYVEFQGDYGRIYWDTVAEALPQAKSDAEKAQVLRAARTTAKEEATQRALIRICAPHESKLSSAFSSGLSSTDISLFKALTYGIDGKDENGETVDGLKKERIMDVINAMDITKEQKDELYYLSGYKESTIRDAPWRRRSTRK